MVSGRDVYPEAKANAERGYALDPHSRETCTILGGIRDWFEHRWDETFKLYDRALELQPGYAPAHFSLAWLCCVSGTFRQQRQRSAALPTWILVRQRLRTAG